MKKILTHKETLAAYDNGTRIYCRANGIGYTLSKNDPSSLDYRTMLFADELWIEVEEEKPSLCDVRRTYFDRNEDATHHAEKRALYLQFGNDIDKLIIAEAVSQAKKEVAKALRRSLDDEESYPSGIMQKYQGFVKELEK